MNENHMDENASGSALPSPISQKINVLKLPAKGLNVKIEPDADVLAALAKSMGVLSISSLSAKLNIKRWHKDGVRVSGPLKAQLYQECVITLEPVEETVNEEINAVFVPETSKLAKPAVTGEANELLIDAEGDDVPEVFQSPFLDVGDIAAEFFALEINPYPRIDGAEEEAQKFAEESASDKADAKENPFAALAALKDKL
ncbi:DUF177 domain-containing protein [Ahrensia sp. 13_GOM-1096m]|uniref:YceD family protein n=1 Tax=Ahrensia sp. 13_GOM-1096m TaxID=1380380 RepID=UPI0009DD6FAC|nr:DUF177 domain-containing protein [Ahrensia sp. 13_GOM-1096m]